MQVTLSHLGSPPRRVAKLVRVGPLCSSHKSARVTPADAAPFPPTPNRAPVGSASPPPGPREQQPFKRRVIRGPRAVANEDNWHGRRELKRAITALDRRQRARRTARRTALRKARDGGRMRRPMRELAVKKVTICVLATAFICSPAMGDELRIPDANGAPAVKRKVIAKKRLAPSGFRNGCSKFRAGAVESPYVFGCGVPSGSCPDGYSCYPLYGAYGPYGGTLYWGAYTAPGADAFAR